MIITITTIIQLLNHGCISRAAVRLVREAVATERPRAGCLAANYRRHENMVGVNMVLAEFVKFKYGLYNSCDVECYEGIMLEPCLLQPCFHVAETSCLCLFVCFVSSVLCFCFLVWYCLAFVWNERTCASLVYINLCVSIVLIQLLFV